MLKRGTFISICNSMFHDVNTNEFRLNLVHHNTRIIDQSNNWNVLLFKEAYHVKEKCPILNNCVKASRDMQPFWLPFNYNVCTIHVFTVSFNLMVLDYIFTFHITCIIACRLWNPTRVRESASLTRARTRKKHTTREFSDLRQIFVKILVTKWQFSC